MKYSVVSNIPKNPKELYEEALSRSYYFRVDEKGTKEHPGLFQRKQSSLSFEEAFKIIEENMPHWVISFRNMSQLCGEEDYWEFGGCNIASNSYGEVFIWIHLKVEVAKEIFEKYKLEVQEY